VPLLTREYLPAFASLADIDELKEQVRTLNLLVLLLPDLHQRVLKVRTGMGWGGGGGGRHHPRDIHYHHTIASLETGLGREVERGPLESFHK